MTDQGKRHMEEIRELHVKNANFSKEVKADIHKMNKYYVTLYMNAMKENVSRLSVDTQMSTPEFKFAP
jgi:hypothetical protein